MEKFCPTTRVEGNRIFLGEPQAASSETEQAQVPAQSWTLPAIIAFGAGALVTWGVLALFEWMERRGAGTGK